MIAAAAAAAAAAVTVQVPITITWEPEKFLFDSCCGPDMSRCFAPRETHDAYSHYSTIGYAPLLGWNAGKLAVKLARKHYKTSG